MKIEKMYVSGMKELQKAMASMTDQDFRRKALNSAGRKAMKPILASAIQNAPLLKPEHVKKNPNITAGTLKGDIKYRGKYNKEPKLNKAETKVMPLSQHEWIGRVMTGKATETYAIPIEYGRDEYTVVRINVFGRNVDPFEQELKELEPNPFMRKALQKNRFDAYNIFKQEILKRVAMQAKRNKPKGKIK